MQREVEAGVLTDAPWSISCGACPCMLGAAAVTSCWTARAAHVPRTALVYRVKLTSRAVDFASVGGNTTSLSSLSYDRVSGQLYGIGVSNVQPEGSGTRTIVRLDPVSWGSVSWTIDVARDGRHGLRH